MNIFAETLDHLTDPASWTGDAGMLALLVQQLLLTVTALALAVAAGLPLALWLGHLGRGGFLAINVSNVGRAVPTFAVLVLLAIGPLGFGPQATITALVLFAVPPILTNGYVGMREVDRDVVEAARGLGLTPWQVVRTVELPLALPLLLNGIRLAAGQVVATATIAALVAGGGLGNIILLGFGTQDQPAVVAGALLVAGFALAVELLFVGLRLLLDQLARRRRR